MFTLCGGMDVAEGVGGRAGVTANGSETMRTGAGVFGRPAGALWRGRSDEASDSTRGLRTTAVRPVAIVLAVCAISLLHYGISVQSVLLHELFKRLYYVPIVIAAVGYGLWGGLGTAGLASLLFVPHIIVGWRGWPVFAVEHYGELILFNVVAVLTGRLADRLRTERNRYRQAAAELQEAYSLLQASTDERLRVDRHVTVGRIASGIAHEVRNPLASLLGCIEILESDVPRSHPKREFITIAKREVLRLDAVVAEFLELAEPPPPSSCVIDLTDTIQSAARLARPAVAARGVTIRLQPSAAALFAAADAEQVQRAILNVILAGASGLRGARVDLAASETDGFPSITIRIPGAETAFAAADVFDPFPASGRGHGLALAAARRLVENQHGMLRAERVDGALEFVMELPAASPSAVRDAPVAGDAA